MKAKKIICSDGALRLSVNPSFISKPDLKHWPLITKVIRNLDIRKILNVQNALFTRTSKNTKEE